MRIPTSLRSLAPVVLAGLAAAPAALAETASIVPETACEDCADLSSRRPSAIVAAEPQAV